VVGLLAALHCVLNVRTPQGTIAWALALIFLPWLSVPGYFLFGRSTLAARETKLRAAGLGRTTDAQGERDHAFASFARDVEQGQALSALAGMPWTTGNDATLLVNGESTFEAIFAAIDAAERYVLVEFFTVRNDELGGRLANALSAAAGRGVRTYLLYDEVGSHELSTRYRRALRQSGVEVAVFATGGGWLAPTRLNFRNHRKIVVVDGERGFVGGHNVGDEYLGKRPGSARGETPTWRCAAQRCWAFSEPG